MSTPGLLQVIDTLRKGETGLQVIVLDGTHVMEDGAPTLTVGVLDAAQSIHILGIAIGNCKDTKAWREAITCITSAVTMLYGIEWTPEWGMTDNDSSIRLALKTLFPAIDIGLCYFHLTQLFKKPASCE